MSFLANKGLTAFVEFKKREKTKKSSSQKLIYQHAEVDFNYIQFCIELI